MSGRPPTIDLLVGLRREGRLAVELEGDRLRVRAPEGVLTPEVRDQLAADKTAVVERLSVESRLLNLPLEEFARQNTALELRVPGLPDTLWWVPTSRGADILVSRGISRGRVWTAEELNRIWMSGLRTREGVLPLARFKLQFKCELQDIEATLDADEGTP